MSSSIAIPTCPSAANKMDYDHLRPCPRQPSKAAGGSSSSSSSYSSSPISPSTSGPVTKSPTHSHSHHSHSHSHSHSSQKQKFLHQRRPSLLSPAISKQECTTINIGDDGQPRLISYLSSSQGFAWNPEIFIPSYMDCEYVPLENRRDPVHEITLSDEEIKKMLPQ